MPKVPQNLSEVDALYKRAKKEFAELKHSGEPGEAPRMKFLKEEIYRLKMLKEEGDPKQNASGLTSTTTVTQEAGQQSQGPKEVNRIFCFIGNSL